MGELSRQWAYCLQCSYCSVPVIWVPDTLEVALERLPAFFGWGVPAETPECLSSQDSLERLNTKGLNSKCKRVCRSALPFAIVYHGNDSADGCALLFETECGQQLVWGKSMVISFRRCHGNRVDAAYERFLPIQGSKNRRFETWHWAAVTVHLTPGRMHGEAKWSSVFTFASSDRTVFWSGPQGPSAASFRTHCSAKACRPAEC